jgi:hypothetical protein
MISNICFVALVKHENTNYPYATATKPFHNNQLKFKIMIKYKMDYIGICITVINVLFYIYNNICVHSSVNKSCHCACKAKCRKQ